MRKVRQLPRGEQFAMIPRDLLRSDGWKSLGINARRFVDFLLLEHMSHAGKENGNLKAPYKQLSTYGLSANYINAAIQEAETAGLVDCRRNGMRIATTYTLTWLPQRAGLPATNRWRTYEIQKSAPQKESRAPGICPLKREQIRQIYSLKG